MVAYPARPDSLIGENSEFAGFLLIPLLLLNSVVRVSRLITDNASTIFALLELNSPPPFPGLEGDSGSRIGASAVTFSLPHVCFYWGLSQWDMFLNHVHLH